MVAVMTRSAARFWWGKELPRDVASLIKHHSSAPWQPITWDQILEERRNRQTEILRRKRNVESVRAVRVSVRYFDQDIYGGWHTYIDGVQFSKWLRPGREGDRELMSLFPMPQPLLFGTSWVEWMVWFARTHRRGTFCGQPRGVAYCWALCDGTGYHTQVRSILSVIR